MDVTFKFENGVKVKDKVSGMEGIVDCVALWLNGCKRYSIQPHIRKGETSKPESWWVDEEQLEFINNGVKADVKPTKTGGPSMRSGNGCRF